MNITKSKFSFHKDIEDSIRGIKQILNKEAFFEKSNGQFEENDDDGNLMEAMEELEQKLHTGKEEHVNAYHSPRLVLDKLMPLWKSLLT